MRLKTRHRPSTATTFLAEDLRTKMHTSGFMVTILLYWKLSVTEVFSSLYFIFFYGIGYKLCWDFHASLSNFNCLLFGQKTNLADNQTESECLALLGLKLLRLLCRCLYIIVCRVTFVFIQFLLRYWHKHFREKIYWLYMLFFLSFLLWSVWKRALMQNMFLQWCFSCMWTVCGEVLK